MTGGGFSPVNPAKTVETEADMKNSNYCSFFKTPSRTPRKRLKHYYIKCINDILKCVNCSYNDN